MFRERNRKLLPGEINKRNLWDSTACVHFWYDVSCSCVNTMEYLVWVTSFRTHCCKDGVNLSCRAAVLGFCPYWEQGFSCSVAAWLQWDSVVSCVAEPWCGTAGVAAFCLSCDSRLSGCEILLGRELCSWFCAPY